MRFGTCLARIHLEDRTVQFTAERPLVVDLEPVQRFDRGGLGPWVFVASRVAIHGLSEDPARPEMVAEFGRCAVAVSRDTWQEDVAL